MYHDNLRQFTLSSIELVDSKPWFAIMVLIYLHWTLNVLEWFHPQCSPERGQSFCPVSSWSLVSVEIYNVANSPSVIHTLYIQIHCEKFCFGKEKIYYIHRKWKWLYRQTVNVFIDHSIPTIPWTYPQFPLYSNFPWLSCMAKSGVWKLRATIWHPAFQKSCHSKEKFK